MTFVQSAAAQFKAREYDVKAAFLFNFTQFVEWPASAFGDTNAPFVIGILGNDPFRGILDELVKDERVNGRTMQVQRFVRVEDAAQVQILFISKSEYARMDSILGYLKGRPILTVGEAGERPFTKRGGMVGLVTESERVRVRVNLQAVQSSGITMSAKLLRIAEIVQADKP